MVTDFFNHVIRRITPSGFSQALFYFPISITFDSNDIVYVADIYNHAIRVLYMNGTVGTPALVTRMAPFLRRNPITFRFGFGYKQINHCC
jgi:hypothetical protein